MHAPDEHNEQAQREAMSSLREHYGNYRNIPGTDRRGFPYWGSWLIASPVFAFLLWNWWRLFDLYMSGYGARPPILTTLVIVAAVFVVHKVGSKLAG